jgi:hypothetical protein
MEIGLRCAMFRCNCMQTFYSELLVEIKGRREPVYFRTLGAERKVFVCRRRENYTIRSFTLCTHYKILYLVWC